MSQSSTITPQIFALALFLTLTWGIFFAYSVKQALRPSPKAVTPKGVKITNFRRTVAAFCLLMLPLSFLLRTGLVLAGFGADTIGIVMFFSLAGTNVAGSVFVVVSLIIDDS